MTRPLATGTATGAATGAATRTAARLAVALASLLIAACAAGPPRARPVPASEERVATVAGPLSTGPLVAMAVEVPAGMTEMQLAADPSFAGAPWQPASPNPELRVTSTGYQTVFVRFRAGPRGAPTRPLTTGVLVDPDWEAATAGILGRPARASRIGLARDDVVAVEIETGRVLPGGLDTGVSFAADLRTALYARSDGWHGVRADLLLGGTLRGGLLDDASGYRLRTAGDTPVPVVRVARISRPIDTARQGLQVSFPVRHTLFLHLGRALRPGERLVLSFPEGTVDDVRWVVDDRDGWSPAVHANQWGYAPSDPGKLAFLSSWTGRDGGLAYPDGLRFAVVDAATGREAWTGRARRRPAPRGGELGRGDLTGAEVHELDFTAFRGRGRFRVCVDTVGCSAAFDVDPWVWVRAATQVARAAFHQRSGIVFDASVTSVRRPRPYHPDDGMVVHWSSQSLMEDFNGLDPDRPQFAPLRDGALDEVAAGAYGGHMDAGDWDRRIQHLEFSRTALELVASFPQVFTRLDLDIPESGDEVPDLVDEALWSLDLYRRLQRADGAVSGGIEAAEHPRPGTVSWTEPLDVYAYAPDPWSSYRYAGVAAQAAVVLDEYAPARAAAYRQSALAAFRWAEGQRVHGRYRSAVAAQRATAAVALYTLTGADRWHRAFLRTAPFRHGPVELLECHAHEWCEAAWLYARLPPERTDPVVRAHVLSSLRRNGEAILAAAASTSYAWAVEHPGVPLVWGLGPAVPKTLGLLRAYLVTGDERFHRAAVTAAAFTLGANPLDTSFVTGMGTRAVRNPLVVDQRVGGLPVWPGIPVFGPHDIGLLADEGWIERYFLAPAGTFPALADTPYLWSWFDLPDIAQMNEYTMHQSHAPTLSTFGTLAALALGGATA